MTSRIDLSGSAHILGPETTTQPTIDDLNRSCLHNLRCVNTLAVKSWLGQNQDKLADTLIEWILRHPHFICWRDGRDIGLLCVEGDPGKGKTMMSISLIDQLSLPPNEHAILIYFFCQGTDSRLNSIAAIIKGLILQLVNQQKELGESVRNRWDPINNCFNEDLSSWRKLWDILWEMFGTCTCQKIYVIIDGLDECQGEEMTDFLGCLVQNGLDRPSKVKWLLTIQTMGRADRKLVAGSQQQLVNLELNSKHVSEAVKSYVISKAAELDHRHNYGQILLCQIETELIERAEDTFLWVYLACKSLEHVARERALPAIQCMPPGLHPFYEWRFNQLCEGDPATVKGCMWILKVMTLAYRPLNLAELNTLSGLSEEGSDIRLLVDHCSPFVQTRGTKIEFVHHSARDYLSAKNRRTSLDSRDAYGHGDIALNCLSYLSKRLKVNLANLPEPSSRRETMEVLEDEKIKELLEGMRYAATFWVMHLESAEQTGLINEALAEQGRVSEFLYGKCLEWLESLILLDELPHALQGLEKLSVIVASRPNKSLLMFVQDATRFLLQHYQVVNTWPLQIYSSAIVFSSEKNLVRQRNLDKLPLWLRQIPRPEGTWTALIQTIAAHSNWINAVAISPDGAHIVSALDDSTIKLWDAKTGSFQKRMTGHTGKVLDVIFSTDSQLIISGSADHTIKVWDVKTGSLQKTLSGHFNSVSAVAVSPNGKMIASGSYDRTIRLWNTAIDDFRKTLTGHSRFIYSVAISPSGEQIVSGSEDDTVKLWDATTGNLLKTLAGHSSSVLTVTFSPDGTQIASGSIDKTINLWSSSTGEIQKTLADRVGLVTSLAFSPDGTQVVSGSGDSGIRHLMSGSRDWTIKIWDLSTGDLQRALPGHSGWVTSVTFSADGKQIISGSRDGTIKLWDTTISGSHRLASHSGWVNAIAFSPDGEKIASGSRDWTVKVWDALRSYEKTLTGHSDWVNCVTLSPDGKHIASGSSDKTIKTWNTSTDECEKTLVGHLSWVSALAFSPDGKLIASGSDDGTIKLWDSTSGDLRKTLGHRLGWIDAVCFSADGTKIASGSHDGTIMLWSVSNLFTVSNVFRNTIGRYFNINECNRVIKASEPVNKLRFSLDGRYISTNLGSLEIGNISADEQNPKLEFLDELYVGRQWIYHGSVPLLYLPLDFEPFCHDVRAHQVSIGLKNGGVLSFCIDYRHSRSSAQVITSKPRLA